MSGQSKDLYSNLFAKFFWSFSVTGNEPGETRARIFLVVLACQQPALDVFEGHFLAHLSLSRAVNKSLQYRFNFSREKKFREHGESSPGQLGEKRERYLCAMLPPKRENLTLDPSARGLLLSMKRDVNFFAKWVLDWCRCTAFR